MMQEVLWIKIVKIKYWLINLLEKSKLNLIHDVINKEINAQKLKQTNFINKSQNKLSLSTQYGQSLDILIEKIRSTQPDYTRCIKNDFKNQIDGN